MNVRTETLVFVSCILSLENEYDLPRGHGCQTMPSSQSTSPVVGSVN
jgi:hypothetical protein